MAAEQIVRQIRFSQKFDLDILIVEKSKALALSYDEKKFEIRKLFI